MNYTTKGSKTRETILFYAKQEFYETGYNNMWIKTLSEKSGIALGNITYYFKKKDDIVSEIYNSMMSYIDGYILELYPDIRTFEKVFLNQLLFYHIVDADDKNKRFYYEVIQKESNRRVLLTGISNQYKFLNESLDYPLNEIEFENVVLADIGSHHELLLAYFENRTKSSLDQLIKFMFMVTSRNFHLSDAQFDSIMETVYCCYKDIDISNLHLLK